MSLALFGGILEASSYFIFFHILPHELRDRALFTGAGVRDAGTDELIPKVLPYLWSNYAPNPASPDVNEYGWRYGGGPKSSRLRILCLGGSTTWSTAASSPERSYPAQLERYLRDRGYSVDVVNGGAPYYSSAELVGTLAFRGIYTKPDVVLIHTGGNDVEPLISPDDYRPDYSHWRIAYSHGLTRAQLFSFLWRIPSWTSRLVSTLVVKPRGGSKLSLSRQLTTLREALLAENDISDRRPVGLENNLRSLVAISRAHGAKPVTVLFNGQVDRLQYLEPSLGDDPALYEHAKQRLLFGLNASNRVIRDISFQMHVPVIPFDRFLPRSPRAWADHVHLHDNGLREKAAFIGDWLIAHQILDDIATRGS